MQSWSILLALLVFLADNQANAQKIEDPVQAMHARVYTALANLGSNPKDRKASDQELRGMKKLLRPCGTMLNEHS